MTSASAVAPIPTFAICFLPIDGLACSRHAMAPVHGSPLAPARDLARGHSGLPLHTSRTRPTRATARVALRPGERSRNRASARPGAPGQTLPTVSLSLLRRRKLFAIAAKRRARASSPRFEHGVTCEGWRKALSGLGVTGTRSGGASVEAPVTSSTVTVGWPRTHRPGRTRAGRGLPKSPRSAIATTSPRRMSLTASAVDIGQRGVHERRASARSAAATKRD